MCSEIEIANSRSAELLKKLNEVQEENAAIKATKPIVKVVKEVQYVTETRFVTFAKNSYELDSLAMSELDKVDGIVDIYGYASPDGNETYNKVLSQKRADAVAAYLRNRNVGVHDVVGKGVVGITSNRIAIVHNVDIDPNNK